MWGARQALSELGRFPQPASWISIGAQVSPAPVYDHFLVSIKYRYFSPSATSPARPWPRSRDCGTCGRCPVASRTRSRLNSTTGMVRLASNRPSPCKPSARLHAEAARLGILPMDHLFATTMRCSPSGKRTQKPGPTSHPTGSRGSKRPRRTSPSSSNFVACKALLLPLSVRAPTLCPPGSRVLCRSPGGRFVATCLGRKQPNLRGRSHHLI